jgi:hypothetical protein
MNGHHDYQMLELAQSVEAHIGIGREYNMTILDIDEINSDELVIQNSVSNEIKRSKVYLRDSGICDVCKKFVMLKEYELGHIIDKSNGGSYDWNNLVVMHRECNHLKPHHNTVEEYNTWKLTKHLAIASNSRPTAISKDQLSYIGQIKEDIPIIPQINNNQTNNLELHYNNYKQDYMTNDKKAARQLVIEYFKNRPKLLKGKINHSRSAAIRELSSNLGINIILIRKWIIEDNLVPIKIIDKSGKQYFKIYNDIARLSEEYNKLLCKDQKHIMANLNITLYQADILLYFLGLYNKVNSKNINSIKKIATKFNLYPINSDSTIKRE